MLKLFFVLSAVIAGCAFSEPLTLANSNLLGSHKIVVDNGSSAGLQNLANVLVDNWHGKIVFYFHPSPIQGAIPQPISLSLDKTAQCAKGVCLSFSAEPVSVYDQEGNLTTVQDDTKITWYPASFNGTANDELVLTRTQENATFELDPVLLPSNLAPVEN